MRERERERKSERERDEDTGEKVTKDRKSVCAEFERKRERKRG